MSIEEIKEELVPMFAANGEHKFYNSIIFLGVKKMIAIEKGDYKGPLPNVEYLDYHDKFLILYRREGEDIYLDIAKMFRKAGNKLYRLMLKKEMIEKDLKFLNVIK